LAADWLFVILRIRSSFSRHKMNRLPRIRSNLRRKRRFQEKRKKWRLKQR
jgi:hypothetical protein